MDKLEMIPSIKQRFRNQLKPTIESIKYCQTTSMASVEIQYTNNPEIISVDLAYMGELVTDEDGNDKDIIPLFNPEVDIVDNATRLLGLDNYSLMMCLSEAFTPEALDRVVKGGQ